MCIISIKHNLTSFLFPAYSSIHPIRWTENSNITLIILQKRNYFIHFLHYISWSWKITATTRQVRGYVDTTDVLALRFYHPLVHVFCVNCICYFNVIWWQRDRKSCTNTLTQITLYFEYNPLLTKQMSE